MAGDTDRVKGRAKEAAGAVTGDDELRREGKSIKPRVRPKKRLRRASTRSRKHLLGMISRELTTSSSWEIDLMWWAVITLVADPDSVRVWRQLVAHQSRAV